MISGWQRWGEKPRRPRGVGGADGVVGFGAGVARRKSHC